MGEIFRKGLAGSPLQQDPQHLGIDVIIKEASARRLHLRHFQSGRRSVGTEVDLHQIGERIVLVGVDTQPGGHLQHILDRNIGARIAGPLRNIFCHRIRFRVNKAVFDGHSHQQGKYRLGHRHGVGGRLRRMTLPVFFQGNTAAMQHQQGGTVVLPGVFDDGIQGGGGKPGLLPDGHRYRCSRPTGYNRFRGIPVHRSHGRFAGIGQHPGHKHPIEQYGLQCQQYQCEEDI